MEFFRYIKNILGFGPDTDELVEENIITDIKAPKPQPVSTDGHVSADPKMVQMIFDKVVEITNASLPQYLAASVNSDKQRQYLYEALDSSIKSYLAQLEATAHEKCMAQWQKERDDLRHEAETLKQRARELEAKRTEMREQNLSAERQKRALSERVRDLEAQVMRLEAEKEQLDLEKHGLLNKIKVAGVHESEVEGLRQQLEQLQQVEPDKKLVEENKTLKQQIEELKKAAASMSEACEAAKVKDAMGTSMLNELQTKAAESLSALEETKASVDALTNELSIREAQIADLKKQIEERDANIEEYEEAFQEMQVIADKLSQFEEVRNQFENQVRELKDRLREAHKDNDTLRTTIKNNIYAHAQQEKALRDEIDRLKAMII